VKCVAVGLAKHQLPEARTAVMPGLLRKHGQIGKSLKPSLGALPARLRTSSLRCVVARAEHAMDGVLCVFAKGVCSLSLC